MPEPGRPKRRACWCGKAKLQPFSPDYCLCGACGTLVSQVGLEDDGYAVRDDETDFYGKQYWLDHQARELGLPRILERSRLDLSGRCLYWLRMLLSYRRPPARVLELGASHGGFVAMLRWAGFDATGLEMSPWVSDLARRTFDVPMLVGPIEEQSLPPASFDVVVAHDVMEHLPDPVTTLKHALALLKPDGILVVQMPEYPDDMSHEELLLENHRFLEHTAKPVEHLYLYSKRAVRTILARLGCEDVHFHPPLFDYDMYFAAGRQPQQRCEAEVVDAYLESKPALRLIRALLDKDRDLGRMTELCRVAEEDRAARLDVIHRQGKQLFEMETTWQHEVEQLHGLLGECQAERKACHKAILKLESQVALVHDRPELPEPGPDVAAAKTIVVDLSPYPTPEPSGVDATTVRGWLHSLARFQPEWRWVLWTSHENHELFAALESPRMRRKIVGVAEAQPPAPPRPGLWKRAVRKGFRLLGFPYVPTLAGVVRRLRRVLGRARPLPATPAGPHRNPDPADVLVYPFGTKQVGNGVGPSVVLWSAQQWPTPQRSASCATLKKYGLSSGHYLYHPSDFREATNHKLLIVAVSMFQAGHPDADLQVVCVGSPGGEFFGLREAAALMGLGKRLVFVPAATEEEQAALLHGCRAVLFPTLQGTAGEVLLHALEFDKPIFCSKQAHVPDLAREAAMAYDLKTPADLVGVLRHACDDGVLDSLIQKSHQQGKVLKGLSDPVGQLHEALKEATVHPSPGDGGAAGARDKDHSSERIVLTWRPIPGEARTA